MHEFCENPMVTQCSEELQAALFDSLVFFRSALKNVPAQGVTWCAEGAELAELRRLGYQVG
jgi:hypothetical protein